MSKGLVVFFVTIGVVLAVTPVSAAAPPGAPTAVTAVQTSSTATIRWAPPISNAGAPITGYYLARDGQDKSGGAAYSTVKGASVRTFTFSLMVPGMTYRLSVAAQTSAGRGPSVVKTITMSSAGLPIVVSSHINAVNGNNPLYAGSYGGQTLCNIYHFSDQVCGTAGISFVTKGYTAATVGGFWILSADTSRTFGCYTTSTKVFTSRTVLKKRVVFKQYGYWESDEVALRPDGTSTNSGLYFFSNPTSYGASDDMPVVYTCPVGQYPAQFGLHVSGVQAILYGASPDSTPLPILGVIRVPGDGYSPAPLFP